MGRLLVRVYLGSIVLGILGLVFAIAEAVALLEQLVSQGIASADLTISFGPIESGFAVVLILYFFLLLPILVVLFFLSEATSREGRPRRPLRSNGPNGHPHTERTAVVLTAYNDEASIGLAVKEFRDLGFVDQVIVVDNNSIDRTADAARAAGATIVPEPRQGYGFACIGGLRYALEHTNAERIVLAEGDMTFHSEDTEKLLPYLDDCDLVLGSRTTQVLTKKGSQMNWFMAWGNMFLAQLIRLRYWDPVFMGQTRLTDVGCTFRAIRRKPLMKIIDQLKIGGHYFSPHMILVALREGLSVIEVPIKFRERVGTSKGAGGDRWRAIVIGLQMVAEIVVH